RAVRSTPLTAETETIWRRRVSFPSKPLRGVRSVRGTLYRIRTRCATTVSGECSGGTQRVLLADVSASGSGETDSAKLSAIALLPSPEEQESSHNEQERPCREDQPRAQIRDHTVDQHGTRHVDDSEQRVQHDDLADDRVVDEPLDREHHTGAVTEHPADDRHQIHQVGEVETDPGTDEGHP